MAAVSEGLMLIFVNQAKRGVVEKVQVNLSRSLRKVLRQLQYLYHATLSDLTQQGRAASRGRQLMIHENLVASTQILWSARCILPIRHPSTRSKPTFANTTAIA